MITVDSHGAAWESEPLSYYEQAKALGVSDDALAGFDLLCDDGMDPQKAADLMVTCQRTGRNAEAFARHMLKLRRAIR